MDNFLQTNLARRSVICSLRRTVKLTDKQNDYANDFLKDFRPIVNPAEVLG